MNIELQPNTYYWIYCYNDGAANRAKWERSTSNVYDDGYAWKDSILPDYDFHMKLGYDGCYDLNLDFIYSDAVEKRLQIDFTNSTGLKKIYVNDQDMGTDLLKEESIPQVDNYIVRLKFIEGVSVNITGSLQRYLYFDKTSITLASSTPEIIFSKFFLTFQRNLYPRLKQPHIV